MMIRFASEALVRCLSKKNIIPADDKEIYLYGYEIMFSNILGLVITLALGVLFQSIWCAVLFYLVFVSLRQYTGGYHADTYLVCNSVFTLTVAAALSMTVFLTPYWKWYYSVIVFVFYFVILFLFAPLDNENKRLTLEEKAKYKRIAFILSGVWCVIAMADSFILPQVSVVITVTMLLVALFLYIGVKLERRRGLA